ncbi:MAG TPA: DUF2267 domain-containing protein [Candidatus Saccharimonadales bacterium]|nr:DUF2267 domain-containing protein [Candidatus Saccharimonadales bacterium]
MQYRELVKTVQDHSGFSGQESEQALRLVVESLAAQLTDDERRDFASQLPLELKELALEAAADKMEPEELCEELSELEEIDEGHAKKQIFAVWETLKDSLSDGQIRHIRDQLSQRWLAWLH